MQHIKQRNLLPESPALYQSINAFSVQAVNYVVVVTVHSCRCAKFYNLVHYTVNYSLQCFTELLVHLQALKTVLVLEG